MFFSPGTPVFPFIPRDVWNWKRSFFSKVGSKTFFLSFLFLMNPFSKAQHALSLSLSPFSVTLLFHFSLTPHNIHYTTPITRHCHANNLPSTEQAVKTQPKLDQSFSFIFHRFWQFICCLSVVLFLNKGDFPANLHTVCPC